MLSGINDDDVLELGVSRVLSGVDVDVDVDVDDVLLDELDKLKSGVAQVLFALVGVGEPLTDERMEKKSGRKGNVGSKGNVSSCAIGGEFSGSFTTTLSGEEVLPRGKLGNMACPSISKYVRIS